MKFLCDVHISYKLVRYLIKRDCESYHVNAIFSNPKTTDAEIAWYADDNGFIVVTKDLDFRDSYILNRSPKKLLKLNTGNSSTEQMIALFENNGLCLLLRICRRIFLLKRIYIIFISSKSKIDL